MPGADRGKQTQRRGLGGKGVEDTIVEGGGVNIEEADEVKRKRHQGDEADYGERAKEWKTAREGCGETEYNAVCGKEVKVEGGPVNQ